MLTTCSPWTPSGLKSAELKSEVVRTAWIIDTQSGLKSAGPSPSVFDHTRRCCKIRHLVFFPRPYPDKSPPHSVAQIVFLRRCVCLLSKVIEVRSRSAVQDVARQPTHSAMKEVTKEKQRKMLQNYSRTRRSAILQHAGIDTNSDRTETLSENVPFSFQSRVIM